MDNEPPVTLQQGHAAPADIGDGAIDQRMKNVEGRMQKPREGSNSGLELLQAATVAQGLQRVLSAAGLSWG